MYLFRPTLLLVYACIYTEGPMIIVSRTRVAIKENYCVESQKSYFKIKIDYGMSWTHLSNVNGHYDHNIYEAEIHVNFRVEIRYFILDIKSGCSDWYFSSQEI